MTDFDLPGPGTFAPSNCSYCGQYQCGTTHMHEIEQDKLIENLKDEVLMERLRYGQQVAKNSVFMMLLSHLARNGQQELAQRYLKAADDAAANVKLEDFVKAVI